METQKIRSFRKLLRLFERLTAAQLKEDSCCHGVTLAQCHTILEIEELGQATTVELSKRLGLDKSTLSRTIDGLVNIDLIERVAHPTDRRFTLLALTSRGQKVADRINHSNDDYYNQVFENIESESQEAVIKHFEKLVLAIRSHQDRLKK
jgi:DNA-binding MarR family transcriptional regulator